MSQKASFLTDTGVFEKYQTVTSLSQAVLVPDEQHADLFLNKADVLFLYKMVCMLSTVVPKAGMKMPTDGPNTQKKAGELWQKSLPAVFMVGPKAELDHP